MKELGIEIIKCLKEILIEVYRAAYKSRTR
jgi:hypothetical protein